mmetsp:Transcript_39676/g.28667  ORF Transcript_39676/g.28667 Transcript_39676/m.28667 type:complete len:119 (+) Transcript_39676:27-383(+)
MAFVGGDKDGFVCSLAAMALYDGDAEVTADQLTALINATGNSVEPYWPSLFASAVAGKMGEIIASRGAGAAPAPVAAAGAAAGAAEADAPAAKVEVEEVDALEGGMDMFGGDAGGGDY